MKFNFRKIAAKVNDRPRAQVIGAWVGSFMLLGYVFYQFVYKGPAEKLGDLQTKVESLNDQILSEQRLARNLPAYRKEVRALETKLKFALQELPDKKEIPNLLSTISTLARDSGLEVDLFRPQPEVKKDFYADVPVQISVEGGYHQVATFFDEVGKLDRIVNINQIYLHEPTKTDEGMRVQTDCTATTFRYLDEDERAQQAALVAEETGKKKRR